jgi:hypothetical protein
MDRGDFSGDLKRAIDCDSAPFIPNDWGVEEHRKSGVLIWGPPIMVKLYLSKKQKDDKFIMGTDLRMELMSRSVLNANVLDHLLAHPELIPEDWKSKTIFFWGTIYCGFPGFLCVRYLYWDGSSWFWGYCSLSDPFAFDSDCPAACV